MTEYLLGIDSGDTMTNAALFTLDGTEIASEARATEMLFPQPGFTERDATAMWIATCDAIHSVLAKTNTSGDAVIGVCATGYGSGLYCVDADGNPTRNGIVSTDSRAARTVGDWESKGLISDAQDVVLQAVWQAQSLTLLKWLQENEPETVARTARILECKDFTKLRLTGTVNTDYSDAAIGGLIDLRTNSFATAMMENLGLSDWIPKLPPLVASTDVAGHVTQEAAHQTGLKAGTPVVSGAVDIVASTLASGVTRSDQLSIVAGTWSINSMPRAEPQTDPIPFVQMPYPIDGMFLACEASATSASNLEWMCQKILGADAEKEKQDDKSIYDVCNEMVADRRERPSDITFFPYLYGGPNNARSSFIGMTASDEKADLVHAVYEGIVFAHKAHVDALMAAGSSQAPTVVRLAGGAAKSSVWAQMFADVLNLPVEIAEGSELGALGACILGAVGIGAFPDIPTAVEKMVKVGRRFEPEAALHSKYMNRYARFEKLSAALNDQWA